MNRSLQNSTRAKARSTVVELLHRLGLLRIWMWLTRKRVVILTLHGTMQPTAQNSWVPLREQFPPSKLREALSTLSRYYRFVSLEDAVAMLSGKKALRTSSIAITFDDGYRNNLTQALPILKEFQAPATLFLATGHVEEQRPYWCDRLDFALQQVPMQNREVSVGGQTFKYSGSSRPELQEFYACVRRAAKSADYSDDQMRAELESLAATLEAESGVSLKDNLANDEWAGVLSWEEVLAAATDPLVEFGGHTVDHVLLQRTSLRNAQFQIRESKQAVERAIGKPCRYFAYPSGSYDPTIASVVKECGYEAAVTSDAGVAEVGDDLFSLRRISLSTYQTEAELLATVSGFWNAVAQLRRPLVKLKGAMTSQRSGGNSTWPASA